MYKFRTMTEEQDDKENLRPDEKRLTPFGAKLRAWSLDELPESFNMLKGEMSLAKPTLLCWSTPTWEELSQGWASVSQHC
jgi:hypothetical protein